MMQRILGTLLVCSGIASAQATAPPEATARVIVTLGHLYGGEAVFLTRDDISITQEFEPRPVTKLTALRGERAGLELYVLVDNCSSCEAGTKFQELRRFIVSQPPTTSIGVAYIQDGRLRIAQVPTKDRERAIGVLNPPSGSKPANPFVALTDLITSWQPGSGRRAVLLISNGVDPDAAGALANKAAEAAIEAAQRHMVTVYTIYHPAADYQTTDSSTIYAGQVQLAHVSTESGGEAYLVGFGPLPTLAPFLSDLANHLANQYLVEFSAKPDKRGGSLQDVMVKSTIPDVEVMAPNKAWIPGSAAPKGSGQ